MAVEEKGDSPSVWYLMIKKEYRVRGYERKLLSFLDNVCGKYDAIYLITEHIGLYEKNWI